MRLIANLVSALGWLLIAATAISTYRADRAKRPSGFDILLFVGALAITPWLRRFPFLLWVHAAVYASIPVLAIRMVRHVRHVPQPLIWLTAVGAVVVWLSRITDSHWFLINGSFQLITMGPVAAVLGIAAMHSVGVTARRLAFACAGAVIQFVYGLWLVDLLGGADWTDFALTLMPLALIAYSIAFATPRWLLSRWQQQEHARYVTSAADREPEERGRLAAADLNEAAARGVPNALTLVALRTARNSEDVVVHAAADPDLAGLRVTAEHGLIGRVMASNAPLEGPVAACETPLPSALARFGERALVAPVQGSSDRPWGVVLAVQRRGSLFPDDDLKLLQQYGRYAATALDHAQLIADARARDRRAAERRLREMESRMSLMLDSIKDYAMIVLDVEGVVVNWHVGARHVFGHTTEQMDNQPAAPLFGMTTADFSLLLDEARHVGIARREGPCLRSDGSRFIGTTLIRPLEGSADGVMGFVSVTRDVTEQRDLESRLRQSQKMEAIGQLAGGIAHDFNNLLTAIQGYAEWLGQSIGDGHTLRPQVDEILRAAERAAGLTRQLLTFSRGQRLQPTVINLSRLLADLLPMLRRVIGEHIEIAENAERTAPVLGDRSQVEQVILNLVVNARDAMPSGGRLTISTRSVWLDDHAAGNEVSPGPYVALTVTDTGIGMDPRTQARIFEPFFTTKEIGHGTGLGLATVYGIVKQMGGLVRVTSRPDEGATFELFFPEASVHEGVAAPEPPREPLIGHETILLVEDDVAVREYVMQVLERYGYKVLPAENRAAAIKFAREHSDPIDLVITDVVMPGGSGTDLANALADADIDAPVLFMSGYNDAVLSADPNAGSAPFLQKPFGATDLLTRVRAMLDADDAI